EELLAPSEAPDRTEADGILLASPRIIDFALLARALSELDRAAGEGDEKRTLTIIGNLVPDFMRSTTDLPSAVTGR
ncbi:MAG TPA: polysaccharide biosynthesis protein, partial [Arenibaculum sp.]|nr:polysaccharide biosynthesis protein [Arenibaculum sp.]